MKKLLIFCILSFNSLYSVVILVHGTFSSKSEWHSPQGEFYQRLEQEARLIGDHVIAFRWSGGTTHKARFEGAQNLANLVQAHAEEKITLIGHSHGGNVINIASTILAHGHTKDTTRPKKPYLIDHVYFLATPISHNYEPNMEIIGTVCNLYSKKDWVQPGLGLYKRCLNKHERVVNLQVKTDDENLQKHPTHRQMHHPLIAQWILSLPFKFMHERYTGFDKFSWDHDGIIYLNAYNKPYYKSQPPTILKKKEDF